MFTFSKKGFCFSFGSKASGSWVRPTYLAVAFSPRPQIGIVVFNDDCDEIAVHARAFPRAQVKTLA